MHDTSPATHAHTAVASDDERRVFRAMCLTGGFTLVEIAGGLMAGSLALLADAGHMFTDSAALAFAYAAFRIARRPADARRSYGYHRFPVLAAFVNGVTLLGIVAWLVFEALHRLLEPVVVLAGPMLVVAVIGLLVNLAAFAILHGGSRSNMNLRGALLHVIGDLLGSVAAIVAALVIMATGWTPIDALLSLLAALLILKSGVGLVRQSGHVLMQGSPPDIDVAVVKSAILDNVPEVDEIHHVHVWSLTPERPIMTLHARLREGVDQGHALQTILACLRERFGVEHATVQLEHGDCPSEAPPPR